MRSDNKYLLMLHVLLAVYAMGGILSKTAAGEDFLSLRFILCYSGLIAILAIYALGWQQVIKKLPLTVAYANKAVTVVWGMIYGMLFFKEVISIKQIIGAVVVIAGIILYVLADEEKDRSKRREKRKEKNG